MSTQQRPSPSAQPAGASSHRDQLHGTGPAARGGALCEARLDRLRRAMAGYVERGELPGIVTLVSRRGEVRVETFGTQAAGGAGGPMRRDTLFRIASLTKPITAAATMILVEECRLRLDEPVDRLLPELADRRVLRRPDGPVDETEPANRPITVRDLLTFRLGTGLLLAPPGSSPIQQAIAEAGVAPGPGIFPHGPDVFMERLGSLPLLHQPGERWLYGTGAEVLGVLIARASGQSLGAFLQERLFAPLGMRDTGFHVPEEKLDRLATCYQADPATGTLVPFDAAPDSLWSRPPAFESGGAGLVSTVDDYLAFCRMLLSRGQGPAERILSRASVELMTTDQITPEQKASSPFFPGFWETRGWGLGLSVFTRRGDVAAVPGRFGWDGGYGTSGYVDPREELIGIVMTQSLTALFGQLIPDFWTSVYQAIDD